MATPESKSLIEYHRTLIIEHPLYSMVISAIRERFQVIEIDHVEAEEEEKILLIRDKKLTK